MKYLLNYNNLTTEDEPQIGDYVICKELSNDPNLDYFIKTNIGQYLKKQYISPYHVKYENIPNNINNRFTKDGFRGFNRNEIIAFSPNKEQLESILKYNI